MKIQNTRIIFLLAAAMLAGGVTTGCKKTDAEKVGGDVKVTAQDTATATKDALNAGKDAAVELATNAVAVVKAGAHKAGDMATNVAATAKNATSNAWNSTKSATTNVVNKMNNLIH